MMLTEYMTPDDICRELDVCRDYVYRKYTKDLKKKNISFWQKNPDAGSTGARYICRKSDFRKLILDSCKVFRRSEYVTSDELEILRNIKLPGELLSGWETEVKNLGEYAAKERKSDRVSEAVLFKEIVEKVVAGRPDEDRMRAKYLKILPDTEWSDRCRPPEMPVELPDQLKTLILEEDAIPIHNINYFMEKWGKSREIALRKLYKACAYTMKYENKTYYWIDEEDMKRGQDGYICIASVFVQSRREFAK